MGRPEGYIPALGHDLMTPLYDPLLRWVMREGRFKHRLVEQAGVRGGQSVLDLGCGTGTLAVMVKLAQPEAEMVGLDGDANVLRIARAKADRAGVNLLLHLGMAYEIPYQDGYFDRVLSSLMLHHLTAGDKQRTLAEAFRVLRSGGELHVVDFGPPRTFYSRLAAFVSARAEQVADNVRGRLPEMFREAGFENVGETGQLMTVAGALSFYRARKP
jgi:ubiquinone/menaquinone biosynthesis C-methylase UbiE